MNVFYFKKLMLNNKIEKKNNRAKIKRGRRQVNFSNQ